MLAVEVRATIFGSYIVKNDSILLMEIGSLFFKKLPTLKDVPLTDRLRIAVGPEHLHDPITLDEDEVPLEVEPGDQPGVLTDGEHYMISEADARPKFISQERLKECTGIVLFGIRKDPPHDPVSLMTHQDSFAVLGDRSVSSPFFRDLEVRMKSFVDITRPSSRQALIVGGMINAVPEVTDAHTKIYVGAVSALTTIVRKTLRIEPYVPQGPYRPQYDTIREENEKDGTALALYTKQKLLQLQRKAYAAPSDFGFLGAEVKKASSRFGGPPEQYQKPIFMTQSSQWWSDQDVRENHAYYGWADHINQQMVQEGREKLSREDMFELSWKKARAWAEQNGRDPKSRYTAEEYQAWLRSMQDEYP